MGLPTTPRLLLGPGPSPVSDRVAAALSAPARSHLDPELLSVMDDIRARLSRVLRAAPESLTLAVSGTGSAGMEAVVANLVEPGRRALVVISGYFGERLADTIARYGGEVVRLHVEWGRAVDPAAVAHALTAGPRVDLVAFVHGETSTGVLQPAREIAALAQAHGALTIVDAVTSAGAVPLEVGAWGIDACFSCSQKGLGAPSGLAPVSFSRRALDRRVACRSFYFDLALLEAYWCQRRYHHTISAPLLYAFWTALGEVEDEGLDARWQRHAEVHAAFAAALADLNLELLPPPAERLWSLNAVCVPDGRDETAVRRALLTDHQIEIGGGLGALAGRLWRIGLMGTGATMAHAARVRDALAETLQSSDRFVAHLPPQAHLGRSS